MTGPVAKLRQHFNWPLFALFVLLAAIGLLNLYSATSTTRLPFFRQQLGWVALGICVMLVTAAIDYRVYYRASYGIYALGLLGLALVLIVGRSVNNSQRWLQLFGFAVQPSEPMKIGVILALARYLHDDPVVEGRSIKHMMIPFLLLLLPLFLVLEQPDLGTALLILAVFLSVMMLIKLKLRSIVLLIVVLLVSMPLSWRYLLKDYQRQRVHTFLDPSSDPDGSGWQSRQAVIAVGSGALWGKGYRQGTQNQLHFLPERWTDFPFAVWAEEWGFVGSAVVVLIYLVLVLWALNLASHARDRFGAVLCVGVAALFFWHTVINLGMVTGLVPVVGVTLPLVSYGGSSMLTLMTAAGLLMNVSVRRSSF